MTYGNVASTAQPLAAKKPDEPTASIAILQAMERLSAFASDTAERTDIKLAPIMYEDVKDQDTSRVVPQPADQLPPFFDAIVASIASIERALQHINSCLSRTAL